MSKEMDRRKWLKSSVILSGGLAFLPNMFSSVKAEIRKKENNLFDKVFVSDNDLAMETTPPEIKARLSFNENPFGPSEKAKQAIKDAIDKSYCYPLFDESVMSEKIASFEGLKESQILMGAGSSPFLLAGAMLYKNGTIISSKPTYEDLLSKAETFGAKVVRLPLTSDYKFDLDAIEKAIDSNTSLVYIVNPNNPTGTVVDNEKLKSFCRRVSTKTMVLVDEAYIDLVPNPAETSLIPLIKEGVNIIVLRTFSKLYGMAGLRFGYMVAQPETIKKFSALTSSAPAIAATTWAAAIASYRDEPFMKMSYDGIQQSKQYLYQVLKKEGYEYVPTSTNFVIFPVREDSKEFVKKMMANGVAVRSWSFNDKEWCRVSIGTMDDMKAFALALAKIS